MDNDDNENEFSIATSTVDIDVVVVGSACLSDADDDANDYTTRVNYSSRNRSKQSRRQ